MESVKKFIDSGVDINSTGEYGSTTLHYALSANCGAGIQGDEKKYLLVKYLLEKGANFNSGTYLPEYFNCHSCNSFSIKCYELFVAKGADLKHRIETNNGDAMYVSTPLTSIFERIRSNMKYDKNVIKSNMSSIKYLLEKGLEVNIFILPSSGVEKKSLLDLAFEFGDFELINLLKKYNAKKRIDMEIELIQNQNENADTK